MPWNVRSRERKCHGNFAVNETQNCRLTLKTAQMNDLQQRAHCICCDVYTQTRPFELRLEEHARGEGLSALFLLIQSNSMSITEAGCGPLFLSYSKN